jgi:hypothetical protein
MTANLSLAEMAAKGLSESLSERMEASDIIALHSAAYCDIIACENDYPHIERREGSRCPSEARS